MKRKLILSLLAMLLLTPWPVAYAYDEVLAVNETINIEPAGETATPQMNAFGYAIGVVTSGDLFYIDSANTIADIHLTLYITNTDELVNRYRYMNLKIGIYKEFDIDQWEEVTWGIEETQRDIYLTMQGGMTEFTLPGYGNYKVTIEKGCFYCYGYGPDESTVFPEFYLTSS